MEITICKLTGVTFGERQKYIKLTEEGTNLRLYRDKENIYDSYAVGVEALISDVWQDLGFIPKEINKEVCSIIDGGGSLQVSLWKKTGGENDFHHGITVVLRKGKKEEF